MLSSLKQNLLFVLHNASLIDYLAYGFVVLCFVLMLFVGILCALKWWWQIGFLVIFVSFFCVFLAFHFVNLELNRRIRNVEISPLHTKQLEFSNTLLVDFNLTNRSKKELKICKTELNFHTISKNELKNRLNFLNPFLTKTMVLKEPFLVGESKEVKAVVENFLFVDYNISTKVECF